MTSKTLLSLSPDTLVRVVASDIEELCSANDNGAFNVFGADVVDELKVFFSVRRQTFSLSFYVKRLLTGTQCSATAFVCALIYIDRVSLRCRYLAITEVNCHRLLCAALLLATKYIDDDACKNALFAQIAGVQVNELNKLELTMLQLLDWRLFIPVPVFSRHETLLINAAEMFDSDASGGDGSPTSG